MSDQVITLDAAWDAVCEILDSGGSFRLYPKGVSMRPHIVEGRDSVLLSKTGTALSRYDIVLYRRSNGQLVLHRIIEINDDGSYDMCGDGQYTVEHGVKGEQIIARVVTIYRGDKELNPNSLSQRLYRFFWFARLPRALRFFAVRAARKIRKLIFG